MCSQQFSTWLGEGIISENDFWNSKAGFEGNNQDWITEGNVA
jgi:hypothetical protein